MEGEIFSLLSGNSYNLLDVIVKKGKDKFVIDLYCKATDCHQYLHYDSCHPDQMKKWSIYSQELRIKYISSKCVNPFVVTYHPHLKNISKITKKHINHLYADPEVRSVFTPLPFVSFRSEQNLSSHLMRF